MTMITPTKQSAKSLRTTMMLALAMGLSTPILHAQEANTLGSIDGTVLDASSGKFLEGAEVSLDGKDISVNTERDGSFNIIGLPAGTYTIVVKYPGLDPKTQVVTVTGGGQANAQFKLSQEETIIMDAVSVNSTKEGMAQAQALQKISIQTKIVAANDQFGEISEGNIGEYLKYLPGVGIDYNSNDARGISLRGLRTQFTIVAVDGTPMASAASGADNRRFELEQIASNNVETYEILKTMSPDIPADATGGYVNMVTKSAFDRQDIQLLTYNVNLTAPHTRMNPFTQENGVWGNRAQRTVRPNLELNFARKITPKLGINFNYRLSEIYHDSPRAEYGWLYAGTGPTSATKYTVADPTLLTYSQTNEQKMTHREAFATKIDYRFSDATKLTISGQWNWYDLLFTQRAIVFGFAPSISSSTKAADLPVNLAGADSSVASTSSTSGARYIRNQNSQRAKYGTTVHANASLSHEFSQDAKAWATAYWSKANSKYRDNTKGFVANAIAQYAGTTPTFQFDNVLSKVRKPDMTIGVPMSKVADLANYELTSGTGSDNIRYRPDTAWDFKQGVRGDYKHELRNLRFPLTIQTGVALDSVQRDIERRNVRAFGLSKITGATLDSNYNENNAFDADFGFGTYDTLDLYKLATAANSYLNYVSTNDWRRITEDNAAAYLRADIKLARGLLVYGGARWEDRSIDAQAVSKANARSKLATANLKYDNLYPSLSVKYTPDFLKSLIIRGGYSNTIGHPDYADVLPNFVGESATGKGDGSITVADPGIKPYTVDNFDIGFDYYLNNGGVLSAWFFRKEVSGFIVSQKVAMSDPRVTEIISDNNLSTSEFSSATLRTNGKGSSLTGGEFQYTQTFKNLPQPFKGLTLQANYTKINIGADDLDTRYAQMLSAVTESWNVVLGYRWHKLSATLSCNRVDDVLIGTVSQTNGSATSQLASYKAPETKVNVKLEYALARHYRIYGELRNIGYTRSEYFTGYADADRQYRLPGREFKYGDPIVVFGVKGEF